MRFDSDLWVPRPLDEVFAFFSDATNLQALTPPWLHFQILTPAPIAMHPGTLIDYRIRLHGIPLSWQSEITDWSPPRRFVDQQRRGPYRRWVHTHTFGTEGIGTRVSDHVEFDVPLGWLTGSFVLRDVEKIFAFRRQVLVKRFA